MKTKRLFWLSNLGIMFLCCFLLGRNAYGSGNVSAIFLRELASARLFGMAGLIGGVADDAVSIYNNPAGLGYSVNPEVTYSQWPGSIEGSQYKFVGYFQPLPFGGLNINYFSYDAGLIDILEMDGSSRTYNAEQDMEISAGFGCPLGEQFFAGGNVKFVNSTLAEQFNAYTLLYDLGFMWRSLDEKYSFGAGVQNLGNGLKYISVTDPPPTSYFAGFGYRMKIGVNHSMLLGADISFPAGYNPELAVGAEYYPGISFMSLRAGYRTSGERNTLGVGVGFKYKFFVFDYGYSIPLNEPGTSQMFSISVPLGPYDIFNRGVAYVDKGMENKAVAIWENALPEEENGKDALDSAKAARIEIADIAFAKDQLKKGEEYYKKGEFENAITCWNKVKDNNPLYTRVQKRVKEVEEELALKNYYSAAVMELEPVNIDAVTAKILTDHLRSKLVATNKFTIAARENMEQMLKEQNFQQTGCTSKECVVQVGKLLGVRKMFRGSIGRIGDIYLVTLESIDVTTGKIEYSRVEKCNGCNVEALIGSVENMAKSWGESGAGIIFNPENQYVSAMLDLDPQNIDAVSASVLSDYLRSRLVASNKFTMVTRENMQEILKEQEIQVTLCTSDECVIKVGQLLNTHKMFSGSIGRIGNTYILELKMYDVRTGKVERSLSKTCADCNEEGLLSIIENIAQEW